MSFPEGVWMTLLYFPSLPSVHDLNTMAEGGSWEVPFASQTPGLHRGGPCHLLPTLQLS